MDDRSLMRLAAMLAGLLIVSVVALSAYIYLDRGRSRDTLLDREVRQVEDQIRKQPGNVDLRLSAANSYLDRGSYDKAIAQASEVLKINAQNSDALTVLGLAHQQKGELATAARYLEQVVSLNQGNEMARASRRMGVVNFQLGDIYLKSGDPAGSVTALRRALEIEPTDADVYRLLGQAHLAAGQLDEAVQVLRSALRFVPDYPETYQALEQIWERQGDQEKTAFAQAMLSYANGDLTSAESGLKRAVETLPDMVEARLGLAMLYEKLARRAEAIDAYRQVLALDQKSYVARQALGRLGVQ